MNRLNKTRLDLLNALPKGRVIAELGVFCGDFSEEILRRCEPSMLYLVDTFEGMVMSGDQNGENRRTLDMGIMRQQLESRFAGQPVRIVKCDSVRWLNNQDSDSLDIVYIDTTHAFQQTLNELGASFYPVVEHGFICGHDYAEEFSGVVMAVNAFTQQCDLPITIYEGDKLASYQIEKLTKRYSRLSLSDL